MLFTTSTVAAWRTKPVLKGNDKTWGRMIAAKGVVIAKIVHSQPAEPSPSVSEIAPFPRRLERLRLGPQVGTRQRTNPHHSMRSHHHRRRKRRRQPGSRSGHGAIHGRTRPGQGPLLLVPRHSPLASGRCRSTRLPPRMTASCSASRTTAPPSHGLWHRRLQCPEPARLAASRRQTRGCRCLLTVISASTKRDPFRHEGISLLRATVGKRVLARCRQVMGTCSRTELLPVMCPDIGLDTASDIANFAN